MTPLPTPKWKNQLPQGSVETKPQSTLFGWKTRRFLEWIRANSTGKLLAQTKGEILTLVPTTADGLRPTIGDLRSLDVGEGVSFQTFSIPED